MGKETRTYRFFKKVIEEIDVRDKNIYPTATEF